MPGDLRQPGLKPVRSLVRLGVTFAAQLFDLELEVTGLLSQDLGLRSPGLAGQRKGGIHFQQ
jgi:hypothetical protein